jgi:hypothetical protein
MTIERILRLAAGFFVMLSLVLGLRVDTRFFWFTGFVGLNLFQSAFTNWCPLMTVLKWAGMKDVPAGHTSTGRVSL